MSAIFDFTSLITVVLLLICTAAFVREIRPGIYDGGRVRACIQYGYDVHQLHVWYQAMCFSRLTILFVVFFSPYQYHLCMSCHVRCSTRQTYERGFKGRSGFSGFMWKLSRIGERLSPYVAACCVVMAVHLLFFR